MANGSTNITHFNGPVKSVNGFKSPTVSVTVASTMDTRYNAGLFNVINNATGFAITLPAATGSGDRYEFIVGTTVTSGTLSIKVASAADYMRGYQVGVTDTAGTAQAFATANTGTVGTESDTISMNGTTQGGRVGDRISCVDVALNVWAVAIHNVGSGVEATCFSAAV